MWLSVNNCNRDAIAVMSDVTGELDITFEDGSLHPDLIWSFQHTLAAPSAVTRLITKYFHIIL